MTREGFSLYHQKVDKLTEYGFVRLALAVPGTIPADLGGNTAGIGELYQAADGKGADLVLFPELSVTGYTVGDLLFQDTLNLGVLVALQRLRDVTRGCRALLVAGLPYSVGDSLYNCAVVICNGRILGMVPKTLLPTTGEFYETRWFAGTGTRIPETVPVAGEEIPFGRNLVFQSESIRGFCFGIEICEDLWSVTPPSGPLALGGATVLLNLSASNELVGKADYRRALVVQQSARCMALYAYASAGSGESTTDAVFGGHALAAENGRLLSEGERFSFKPELTWVEADVEFLLHERRRSSTFRQDRERFLAGAGQQIRSIPFQQVPVSAPRTLERIFTPHPFVPRDSAVLDKRCAEIFAIQSTALARRLTSSGARSAVIGLSGGLDSTLALLVTREAFRRLGLELSEIKALTMPGFGTTERTRGNAEALCRLTGISLEVLDIRDMCHKQMIALGHSGEPSDTAYENIQARMRTSLLMNRANMCGGLVIGTGDLSELALGWCTYNGDHMSMYGVNGGVPKTLVRFLIRYVADHLVEAETAVVLNDILDTPISPELLPPDKEGRIAQKTEEVIGPYELHDFFLYHVIRCGRRPGKVLFLASRAFNGIYTREDIEKWLRVFLKRFFSQQFKRSCLPDGPKVGTIGLSPRADWRMPSDASGALWLEF